MSNTHSDTQQGDCDSGDEFDSFAAISARLSSPCAQSCAVDSADFVVPAEQHDESPVTAPFTDEGRCQAVVLTSATPEGATSEVTNCPSPAADHDEDGQDNWANFAACDNSALDGDAGRVNDDFCEFPPTAAETDSERAPCEVEDTTVASVSDHPAVSASCASAVDELAPRNTSDGGDSDDDNDFGGFSEAATGACDSARSLTDDQRSRHAITADEPTSSHDPPQYSVLDDFDCATGCAAFNEFSENAMRNIFAAHVLDSAQLTAASGRDTSALQHGQAPTGLWQQLIAPPPPLATSSSAWLNSHAVQRLLRVIRVDTANVLHNSRESCAVILPPSSGKASNSTASAHVTSNAVPASCLSHSSTEAPSITASNDISADGWTSGSLNSDPAVVDLLTGSQTGNKPQSRHSERPADSSNIGVHDWSLFFDAQSSPSTLVGASKTTMNDSNSSGLNSSSSGSSSCGTLSKTGGAACAFISELEREFLADPPLLLNSASKTSLTPGIATTSTTTITTIATTSVSPQHQLPQRYQQLMAQIPAAPSSASTTLSGVRRPESVASAAPAIRPLSSLDLITFSFPNR